MARFEIVIGDSVEEDESIVEIATDKVDSEIPSPVEGILKERLYNEGDVVPVGKVIAVLETEGEVTTATTTETEEPKPAEKIKEEIPVEKKETKEPEPVVAEEKTTGDFSSSSRFYAPTLAKSSGPTITLPPVNTMEGDQIMEMDRMRKMIADHMVMSKQVSPHVTSFIDVDVTAVVNWRNKVKDEFLKREGEKLTFTPIFIDAAAKALKDFPQVNASVDGYNIIYRKHINIGMATALENGNLIVPVIRDADEKSLLGLVKAVNDLATRARANKLNPDEIAGGTFTTTNFGSFDSLTGTPIINQPQVAILGIGAIRKKPVVLETKQGDVIAIRHIMILSLAYDHRVVDGALGGMYIRRVKELLENFSEDTVI